MLGDPSEDGKAPSPLPLVRLAEDLRAARAALRHLENRFPEARHAIALLERDLLPRCGSGDPYLVCGIVGPNNAGKSALFNALVGRDLSPSEPTGGATRRMVGAAREALLQRLRDEPDVGSFRLATAGLDALRGSARVEAEDPTELLVVADESLPEHVLLIDTPDFDSVLAGNRSVSEALVAVADVVVAVVTRHSYQNRAVVQFFQDWLRHRRPWILVYNEAIDADVARSHSEKLIRDIGTMPVAAYWAPHRIEIQRGEASLDVLRLALPSNVAAVDGKLRARTGNESLRDLLFDRGSAAEVKALAFQASLARLRDALADVTSRVRDDAEGIAALRARAAEIAGEAGLAIAAQAMPAAPFIDAFRVVLDRRTNVVSRSWRALVRGVRVGIESVPRLLGGGRDAASAAEHLGRAEVEVLRRLWPEFWENLARDLGREARAPARRNGPVAVAAVLDRELSQPSSAAADRGLDALRGRGADLAGFQRVCEGLIEEAIEARGFDIDIQAAADIATLAPVALATAMIITTSGLGADLAAAGGGALGTFLFEKYSHLLGSGITKAARQRWTETRGRQIAELLLEAALPESLGVLDAAQRDDSVAAAQLAALQERFA